MKEVLNKIEKIYDDLVVKQNKIDDYEKELNARRDSFISRENQLDAKANDLAAKQRIVTKYENFDDDKKKLEKLRSELKLKEADINIKYKIFLEDESKFKIEKKNHEKMVEAYKEKSARLNKVEADLIEEKKNLKKKVLEEIGKKING